MKNAKHILAAAALLAVLSAPVRAEDAQKPGMVDNFKVGFSQAIKDIQTWFGDDTPETLEPAAGEAGFDVTNDDMMQVPTPIDPSIIEPAAGSYNDDVLQVPPPYAGPDADAATQPRASAFDNNASNTAFGESAPTPEELAGIETAAGEGADLSTVDCKAVLDAASNAVEGADDIDTALIEACEGQQSGAAAVSNETSEMPAQAPMAPAQPAFEVTPMQQPLPETEPATGE